MISPRTKDVFGHMAMDLNKKQLIIQFLSESDNGFSISLDSELEYVAVHIGGNRLLIRPAYTCVIYCCGSTIYC